MRWAQQVDRERPWSAGMVPCVNGKRALCARRFHFRSPMRFITWLPSGSLSTKIWR